MVDVAGLELTPDDLERLQHPQVGGVILFARNFAAPLQLIQLSHSIRELRKPSLLIAVDHEGGRVQRFRHGFTPIPAMRELGRLWDRDPARRYKMVYNYLPPGKSFWTIRTATSPDGLNWADGPPLPYDGFIEQAEIDLG